MDGRMDILEAKIEALVNVLKLNIEASKATATSRLNKSHQDTPIEDGRTLQPSSQQPNANERNPSSQQPNAAKEPSPTSTAESQPPVQSIRRQTMELPPKLTHYKEKILSYRIYDHKSKTYREFDPDLLFPQNSLSIDDDTTRHILDVCSRPASLNPLCHVPTNISHADSVLRATLQTATEYATRAIDAQRGQSTGDYIDIHTVRRYLQTAKRNNINHPLVLGQALASAISKHKSTQRVWSHMRTNMEDDCGVIIPTLHILDIYQTAATQVAVPGTAAVNVRITKFRKCFQGSQSALSYVNTKLTLLRDVAVLFIRGNESPDNALVISTVYSSLNTVLQGANANLKAEMQRDRLHKGTLPWTEFCERDYSSILSFIDRLSANLTKFARNVDEETSYRRQHRKQDDIDLGRQQRRRPGASTRSSTDAYQTSNKRSDTRANQSGQRRKGIWVTKADLNSPCKHPRCLSAIKKGDFGPHNVGGIAQCSHFCGQKLQGHDCPNEGINDAQGRHLYRKSCQAAMRKRKAKSTATADTTSSSSAAKTPDRAAVNLVSLADNQSTNPYQLPAGSAAFRVVRATDEDHTEETPLALYLDSAAEIMVIKPVPFGSICHLVEQCGEITVTSLAGSTVMPMYEFIWHADTDKYVKVKCIVHEFNCPGDGLFPAKLFSEGGLSITASSSSEFVNRDIIFAEDTTSAQSLRQCSVFMTTTSDKEPLDAIPPAFPAPNSLAPTCRNHGEILTEFLQLHREGRVTVSVLEDLLDRAQTDHPHTFDAAEAIQELLMIERAAGELDTTNSELYHRFLEKLLHLRDINVPTPALVDAHAKALTLFEEYRRFITSKDKFGTLNTTPAMQRLVHTIDVDDTVKAASTRAIPMAPHIKAIFRQWHRKMVEANKISPATEEEQRRMKFLAHHIPILKPGAMPPFGLTDYRFVLNIGPAGIAIMKAPDFAFPTKDDWRHLALGCKVFSVIDFQKFFPSIPADYNALFLHPLDGKLWKYNVVVQGDRTAPWAAHRVIMDMFADLIEAGKVLVHMDDLVLATETVEEHLELLEHIFKKCREYGLNINQKKSTFCQPSARVVGLILHEHGVEPDMLRYSKIFRWPTPRSRKEVRAFVGFMLYFNSFVKNCSVLLAPLQDMLNSESKFKWTAEMNAAFDTLKAELISASVLKHIDYSKTMHINVDTATSNGIGAVLYQEDDDGKLHPIAFASRRLNKHERNYSPTDAELVGVYWAVTRAFSSIIHGSRIVIHSDHANLRDHINIDKASSARRKRWCYYLGDYNIVSIVHEKGKTFTDADTLSRLRMLPEVTVAAVSTEPESPRFTTAFLREHQAKDTFCKAIMGVLNNPDASTSTTNKHHATRCRINNGILEYRDFIPHRGEHHYVVVAPESIRKDIINRYHHTPHGHMGSRRAELTIRASWWWPNMISDVRQARKECQLCNTTSASGNLLKQGTLSTWQPLTLAHEMAIDLYDVADFGGSRRANKIALVCVYTFPRFPVIVPIPSKSADVVATALFNVMVDHGFVKIIRHDAGSEFEGSVKSMCEHFGIAIIKTARKAPHSNGAAERVNEAFKTELRRFRQTHPEDDWELAIPEVHFKLRSVPNQSTGFTPYELMGHTTPTPSGAPVDDLIHSVYDMSTNDVSVEHVRLWNNKLIDRRAQALANDIAARDKRLIEMNKHRKPLQFELNDWIRVKSPASAKTALQVSDPLKVIEIEADKQRYKVQDQSTGRSKWVTIAEMVQSTAPVDQSTTATARSNTGPAAVLIMDRDLNQVKIAEHHDDMGKDNPPRRRYANKRPSGSRTQQRWVTTAMVSTNYEVLEHFNFEKRDDGALVVPMWVCKRHPQTSLLKPVR